MKKGKGQVPIKGRDERLNDINKYGGYNKATGAYFMLVKSKDKKDNEIRTIEFVPLYLKNQIEKSDDVAIEYLKSERNLREPEILLKKIKIDTLFKVDGFKMWLSGRTGGQLIFKCANQLVLSGEDTKVLKKVRKGRIRTVRFLFERNVNNAIKIYCKSIFDALNEDDSALIRFYRIEL